MYDDVKRFFSSVEELFPYRKYNVTDLDQFHIQSNRLDFNETDVEVFNAIYKSTLKMDLNKIVRTESGAISNEGIAHILNRYAYDVIATRAYVMLTVIVGSSAWKFTVGHINKEFSMNGWKSWRKLLEMLSEDGIDMEDYAIDNGHEVKKTIESPMIDIKDEFIGKDKTVMHAYHIDFHSSYPSGLIATHPEFTKTIERLYNGRKEHSEYKDILNMSIGYMQSESCCNARYAQLSRDAIKDNNDRIRKLTDNLIKEGHRIIGHNTDGIWFLPNGKLYHDELEGSGLGHWSYDHSNCMFRAKSKGCYEFREDGKVHAVMRGVSKLDAFKDRDKWDWGDIFLEEASTITFSFDEENGITMDKGE